MRKTVSTVLTALFLAATTTFAQPAPDTVVVAQASDATTLDPADMSSIATDTIAKHLFGRLLEVTADGDIVPYFAESYEVSDAGTEITFQIRDGLVCHDGEPFTAEDVVYTFERAADPDEAFTGNTPGFLFDTLGYAGARVDGPLTATILTEAYTPIAAGLLAEVHLHCKDSYESMTRDQAADSPIGSGPYRFGEWTKDERLVLERFDAFELRDAPIERIEFRVVPEASTRAAELIAGNVHVADAISPDQIDPIEGNDGTSVMAVSGTSRVFAGFNMGPAFSDTEAGRAIASTEVRRALQYAVDVPTICRTLLSTECERATGMVNPPNDHPDLEPYPYDPETAERLLDEAGYPRGEDGVRFELTLEVPSGRPYTDPALAIGQYLSDIGVQTEVELQDFGSVFVPALIDHEAGPMFMVATGGATWSALYDMSDLREPDGATNYVEWRNDTWFSGWDRIAQTRDPAEVEDIKNEMLQAFYDDPPWLMLYYQPNYYGVSDRLEWEPRRDARISVVGATLD